MEKLNFSRKNKSEFEEANSIYYSFCSLSSQDSSHNISNCSFQNDEDKTIEPIIILDDSNEIENNIMEIPEKLLNSKLKNDNLNILLEKKEKTTSTPRKRYTPLLKKKLSTDMSFSKSICDSTSSNSKKILHSIENQECFINDEKRNESETTKIELKFSSDDAKSVQKEKITKIQNIQLGATSNWVVESINNVQEKESAKGNDEVNNEKLILKAIDNASQAQNKNSKALILTNENQLIGNSNKVSPKNLRNNVIANEINSGKSSTNKELIQKRRTLHAAYTFANKKNPVKTPEKITPNKMTRNKSIRKSILKTTLNSPSMFSSNFVRKRQSVLTMEKKRQSLFDKKRQSYFGGEKRQSILLSEQRILDVGKKCLTNAYAKNTGQNIINKGKTSVPKKYLPKLTEESDSVVSSSSDNLKEQKSNLNSNKTCQICLNEIPLSLFDLHEKVHKQKKIHILRSETLKCNYCGKGFAFTKALDKHLIENCIKIPILEKRKLLNRKPDELKGKVSTKTKITSSSTESISADNMKMLPPPSIQTNKKKIAHSGVWTPKKTLFCNICPDKIKFDNILQYTDHNLQFHNY